MKGIAQLTLDYFIPKYFFSGLLENGHWEIHQVKNNPRCLQIDLPCELGAKGMKIRMCTVTFHKSNNNTLDLSGIFIQKK